MYAVVSQGIFEIKMTHVFVNYHLNATGTCWFNVKKSIDSQHRRKLKSLKAMEFYALSSTICYNELSCEKVYNAGEQS